MMGFAWLIGTALAGVIGVAVWGVADLSFLLGLGSGGAIVSWLTPMLK